MAAHSWYVRSKGRVYGPFGGKQISEMALSGRISSRTEVASSAEGPWCTASAVKGLTFPSAAVSDSATVAAAPQQRPLTTKIAEASKAGEALRLWNPNAAANWSILLTPAFGALLHASNWNALGKPERANINRVWAAVTLVWYAISAFVGGMWEPENGMPVVLRVTPLGLLCGWYFTQGRAQAQYVKAKVGVNYIRNGWARPMLSAAIVIGMCYAVSVGCAVYVSMRDESQVASLVRPMILQQLRENPDLQGITIQDLSLVQTGGGRYNGFVDVSLNGESERIPLEVLREKEAIHWELNPAVN